MTTITGMLVGYYNICPRKAWLSRNGLEMEQESEAVALGRLIDETSYGREKKHLHLSVDLPNDISLVGKVDWANLEDGVLHETKKSPSAEESHFWQLRFYLWLLHLSNVQQEDGSPFTGEINYPKLRKTQKVELLPEHRETLRQIVAQLKALLQTDVPPPRIAQRKFCQKCAFEEFCYG